MVWWKRDGLLLFIKQRRWLVRALLTYDSFAQGETGISHFLEQEFPSNLSLYKSILIQTKSCALGAYTDDK